MKTSTTTTHFSSVQEEETSSRCRSSPRATTRRVISSFSSRSNSSSTTGGASVDVVQTRRHESLGFFTLESAKEGVEALQLRDSGRERLKRHREEVAGRVPVPDKWGKEGLLKDWMDNASFDALLAPKGLESAREALVAEGRGRRMEPYNQNQRLRRIGSMC